MYTDNQVVAVAKELRSRYMRDEVESHEIVVLLTVMHKQQKIKTCHIKQILFHVFYNNVEGVMRALKRASSIMSDELILSILEDVASDSVEETS